MASSWERRQGGRGGEEKWKYSCADHAKGGRGISRRGRRGEREAEKGIIEGPRKRSSAPSTLIATRLSSRPSTALTACAGVPGAAVPGLQCRPPAAPRDATSAGCPAVTCMDGGDPSSRSVIMDRTLSAGVPASMIACGGGWAVPGVGGEAGGLKGPKEAGGGRQGGGRQAGVTAM